MELRNRVALVTGGAHRLGKAIALALGRAGAKVVIHYHHSAPKAETTVAELQALGIEALAISGDVAIVKEVEHIVDQAASHWGRLDILVNNVGIWGATPIGTATQERWDELMAVNVRSAFFAAQRATPHLRITQGTIVNIADVGALRPWRNHTPYLVSKGGVITLTEALAKDLAPEIRVNAVAPGAVLLPDDWTQEQADATIRTVPLRRLGNAEDIGQAVLYLVQADYVTGVTIPVDGGQRLH